MVDVDDPCNCNDAGNIVNADGSISLFRDVLTFTGTGIDGTGTIVCQGTNCSAFRDSNDDPIFNAISGNLTTNITTSPGTVEFFRRPGNYGVTNFTVGGTATQLPAGTCIDNCQALAAAAAIPTMSQWGLIIFGLLMLNLGLIFIRKKEVLFNV